MKPLVTIFKCQSMSEADRIVKELGLRGVHARIKDKASAITALFSDLKPDYPYIEIQVEEKFCVHARECLEQAGYVPG